MTMNFRQGWRDYLQGQPFPEADVFDRWPHRNQVTYEQGRRAAVIVSTYHKQHGGKPTTRPKPLEKYPAEVRFQIYNERKDKLCVRG